METKKHEKKHKHKKHHKKHKKKVESKSAYEWVEASPSISLEKVQKEGGMSQNIFVTVKSSNDVSTSAKSENESSALESKREEWMSNDCYVPTLSKNEMQASKRRKHEIPVPQEKQEAYKERELNRYWKENGTGVPDNHHEKETSGLQLPSSSVGDGGYSWLKKAYQRVQEQAKKEGRTMEDVASERWESLEKLEQLLNEASIRRKELQPNRAAHNSDSKYKVHDTQYPGSSKTFKNDYESRQYKDKKREADYITHKFPKESDAPFKKKEEYPNAHTGSHSSSVKKLFHKPEEDNQDFKNISYSATKSSYQPSWKRKVFDKDTSIDEKILMERGLKSSSTSPEKLSQKGSINVAQEHHIEPEQIEQENLILDVNELNDLAAECMRAEILGDLELASKLNKKLDAAREASKNAQKSSKSQAVQNHREVLLTKTDRYGISRPLYAPENKDFKHMQQYKRGKMSRGKQNQFLDDSKYSLKQMFQKEKLTTADDQLEMFLDVAASSKESTNNDFDDDDVSGKMSKRMSRYPQEEKEISKAIQEDQRHSSAIRRCQFCIDQSHRSRHLIVSVAKEVLLCLPPYKSLTDGHCLIVPKAHVVSSLLLDDDEWLEIQVFKKRLISMFADQDKCVTFMETSINHRHHPHSVIECIPMPKESGELAPLYFKKAIEESESEWAQNKKLIDLFKKDVRHSVPKGLPFFSIEFGVNGGFAHIVEDEKRFSKNFGREIIGGMLDIESQHTMKNRKEEYEDQIHKVLKFKIEWEKYEETTLKQ